MEKLWNLSKMAVPMEKLWKFRLGGKKVRAFFKKRPMVDVSDSETRKCRVHVSECVTRK